MTPRRKKPRAIRGTILVIEDSATSLELVTILLEEAGFEVVPARSAEAGLRLARAKPPDLILMDFHLPGIEGDVAVWELKSDDRTRHVPTIALTAESFDDAEAHLRRLGFDGYLAKPISTRTFRATIEQFLEDCGEPR